ncbi:hypothetical protein FOZ63_019375 [Perkinsus olseni]|uniref:Uncharacterized protein n=1 Tax=Perkinsus olseni TaxID=32597 RepID=A0A7J6PFG1_PEROL|nr:hypothetical protein FOZ62_004672 [Perkinsus olseni]KAF4752576.1 hypothetical protein FOZ63_019375 [Perkinsus olseni]
MCFHSGLFTTPRFAEEIGIRLTDMMTAKLVQAVNSENSKNLQADVWRMMQLERELVFNKEHPSYHFGTGNKDTLKQIPREALLNFHNKW